MDKGIEEGCGKSARADAVSWEKLCNNSFCLVCKRCLRRYDLTGNILAFEMSRILVSLDTDCCRLYPSFPLAQ